MKYFVAFLSLSLLLSPSLASDTHCTHRASIRCNPSPPPGSASIHPRLRASAVHDAAMCSCRCSAVPVSRRSSSHRQLRLRYLWPAPARESGDQAAPHGRDGPSHPMSPICHEAEGKRREGLERQHNTMKVRDGGRETGDATVS